MCPKPQFVLLGEQQETFVNYQLIGTTMKYCTFAPHTGQHKPTPTTITKSNILICTHKIRYEEFEVLQPTYDTKVNFPIM